MLSAFKKKALLETGPRFPATPTRIGVPQPPHIGMQANYGNAQKISSSSWALLLIPPKLYLKPVTPSQIASRISPKTVPIWKMAGKKNGGDQFDRFLPSFKPDLGGSFCCLSLPGMCLGRPALPTLFTEAQGVMGGGGLQRFIASSSQWGWFGWGVS